MIKNSPCDAYIKYLILDDAGHSNATIRGFLEGQSLDYLGDAHLNMLRAELSGVPECFQPRNRRHAASFEYVRAAGVLELFQTTPDMAGTFEILDKPRAKEFIETAIITGAPANAIAEQLHRYYGVPRATPLDVVRYRWFYWNMDLVDSTDLRGIIKLRYARDKESSNAETKLHGKVLSSAMYSDPRWIVANMPRSPISAFLGQVSLGMMPSKIDLEVVLAQTRIMTLLRAHEESFSRMPESDRRLLNLLTSAKILEEFSKQRDRPEENLRKELEAIQLRTDTVKMPYVLTVSGGQHTADLAALPAERAPHE